ncbi:hypothetical protein AURDEDRAFT_165620 [Auricularia subglabra TFB-10046 SS5]|nr:hypothetical protein AURDEDRAFT_165620 [Auricularia subglabra TFB-10046 SS5]
MALRMLDPNRYVTGIGAAYVSARARVEKATVAIATERRDFALQSLRAARERFADAEAAYQLCEATLDDATAYDAAFETQLRSSLGQLATPRALFPPKCYLSYTARRPADNIVHHQPVSLSVPRLCILRTDDDRAGVGFVRQWQFPRLDWLKLCRRAVGGAERVRMLGAILPHLPALASHR